jgi:hypothetical protein
MTTKAPSMEPLAMPNDASAAFAGGAGAAVDDGLADAAPRETLAVADALFDDAPEALLLAKLAEGPMALFDTVLTAPEIVARLDTTLATGTDELAADAGAELIVLGKVTWMRISSHWAPIHSS